MDWTFVPRNSAGNLIAWKDAEGNPTKPGDEITMKVNIADHWTVSGNHNDKLRCKFCFTEIDAKALSQGVKPHMKTTMHIVKSVNRSGMEEGEEDLGRRVGLSGGGRDDGICLYLIDFNPHSNHSLASGRGRRRHRRPSQTSW